MPPLNPHKIPLEVAVFGPINAIRAEECGAQRVELNLAGSYKAGGLTPTIEELREAKTLVKIPVRVMIRPRGAPHKCAELDFIYKEHEKQTMLAQIAEFKNAQLMNNPNDGFVFGALSIVEEVENDPMAGFEVDKDFCKQLVDAAHPIPCFFHRAFDQIIFSSTEHSQKGIGDLVECGFKGLLTAGGLGGSYYNHFQELDALRDFMNRNPPLRDLELIVGGGLRTSNVDGAIKRLQNHVVFKELWLHTAALKGTTQPDDYTHPETDSETGRSASPASDSEWEARKQADKRDQKARKEARRALLAKDQYEPDEVEGARSEDNELDKAELRELVERLALSKPA